MERTEAGAAVLVESSPPSTRCSSSSGCQSGWTLYLDHSDAQRCYIHGQTWMLPADRAAEPADDDDDDSMLSDASSGPAPTRLLHDDDEALRRDRWDEHRCYSGSASSASAASSVAALGSRGSSWSRIFQLADQASRPSVAVDDDLDDTASSSAVFFPSPMAVV